MTERLKEGDLLGPYRIESFLGEGGMGQVYRAVDPSLGRPVALKLIAGRGEREEATARLLAEARHAAALNHPNICTVYQVGDAEGMHFIAMELVEGTPLSARIAKGPLPPREVARIGAALASALAVAHDRGILHRDLKPDNVFLTNDGTPKLLDFGLAKRIIAVDGEAPLTTDGLLRGTPSYMSPEQATLQSLDARSDIFSLGIVLYEMATGVRPFLAETPTKELIRIARDEPMAAEALVPSIPPALGAILRKCLEKDPGDRYQHASDLAVDLRHLERDLKTVTRSGPSPIPAAATVTLATGPTTPPRTAARWIAIAAAAGLGVGLLAALLARDSGTKTSDRLSRALLTPITRDSGVAESPAFAPDGETVVYSSDRTGDFEIYVRRASGGRELNITNDAADDVQPAVSPDGRLVAFVSTRASATNLTRINPDQEPTGGDLWVIPPLGGEARLVAKEANFPVFSPDGKSLYFVGGPERHKKVFRVPVSGGEPESVLDQSRAEGEYRRVSVSRDGKWLLLGISYRGIYLVPVEGGRASRLSEGNRPVFCPMENGSEGVIFSAADQNLVRSAIDFEKGKLTGGLEKLTVGRGWDTDAAVDASGRKIAFSAVDVVSQIVTMPLDERTGRAKGGMKPLISGEAYDMDPALSPDGNELVFVSSGRWPGFQRVFRANIRKGTLAPLSEAAGVSESNPLFSPDGKWLVFERDRNDSKGELLLLPREGGAPRRIAVGAEKSVAVWYPDSRRVLFQSSHEGKAVFEAASIEGGQATRVLSENYDTMHPAVSPDGRWLAFAGNRDGDFDVFLRPLEGGEVVPRGKTPLRDGHPFFSNDSRWLYFQPGHQNVFRVPVEGGDIEPVTSEPTHNLYLDAPRLTPDGSAILLSRCLFHSNVWVLDLGSATP